MKGIENMTKEQRLDHAIIKMAQLSEILLKQREMQDFSDLGEIEFERRFDIAVEFLFSCHMLWISDEREQELKEREKRKAEQMLAQKEKELEKMRERLAETQDALRESKNKNKRMYLSFTNGGKNGIQHNRQN